MKTKTQVSAIYFLVFAPLGVYVPYLPVYFKDAGYSATEVSVLFAVAPLLKMLTSPLWGHAIDVSGRRRAYFLAASLLTLVGSSVWVATSSFWPCIAGMAVYAFARGPMPALADTAAVALVQDHGYDYARIRVWGSIGFIAACVAAGFAVDEVGLDYVPVYVLGTCAVLVLAVWWTNDPPLHIDPAPTGTAPLLTRSFVLVVAASTLHNAALSPYNTFYGIHLADLGLAPSATGISWAVAVAAEITVLLGAGWLLRRFGTNRLLAVSLAASVLRWFLTAHSSSVEVLIAVQALHALTFGTFFVAAITYVGEVVPASRRTTGQTLFGAVTFGLGPLLGTLGAGQAYVGLGGAGMFNAAAALDLLTLVLVVALLPEPRLASTTSAAQNSLDAP